VLRLSDHGEGVALQARAVTRVLSDRYLSPPNPRMQPTGGLVRGPARAAPSLSALRAPQAAKPPEQLTATRGAILGALRAAATGKIPSRGPRGGVRWSARYFVRRVASHVMAHVWEIERRAGTRSSQ
jgi:hypothetical protein